MLAFSLGITPAPAAEEPAAASILVIIYSRVAYFFFLTSEGSYGKVVFWEGCGKLSLSLLAAAV